MLVVAGGVGMALVAFGVVFGLSRGGADVPAATPTAADTTVTSTVPSDDLGSTIPEPVEPVRPVTSARTIETFPYLGAVLAPDGRLIFYQPRLDEPPADGMFPWCVQDVGGFTESCADVPMGFAFGSAVPAWTRASDKVVWTTVNNQDVFVYDVPSNTVANLTDDGIDAESAPENLGKGSTDILPTWVSNDEEIAFFRPYSEESLFRYDLHSIGLDGSETAYVEGPTYERMFQGKVRLEPRWEPRSYPPLPDGGRGVLVAGNGAIFSVDLDRGTTSVVVEYTDQYEEETRGVAEALGAVVRPSLWPIVRLTQDKLVLADPLVMVAINSTGHPADATSGAYVLEVGSGTLFPLFRQSPNGEYGGPTAVALSPGGSELLVVWFDSSLVHPDREERGLGGRFIVSILDVDSIDEPIDPRDLPQVYGSATEPALFYNLVGLSVEWAVNDTVLLNAWTKEGPGSVLIELNRG